MPTGWPTAAAASKTCRRGSSHGGKASGRCCCCCCWHQFRTQLPPVPNATGQAGRRGLEVAPSRALLIHARHIHARHQSNLPARRSTAAPRQRRASRLAGTREAGGEQAQWLHVTLPRRAGTATGRRQPMQRRIRQLRPSWHWQSLLSLQHCSPCGGHRRLHPTHHHATTHLHGTAGRSWGAQVDTCGGVWVGGWEMCG